MSFQLPEAYPFYLANKPVFANKDLAVTNKYTGKVATHVAQADAKAIDQAIDAAVKSQPALKAMEAWQRKEVIEQLVAGLKARREELSYVLAVEAGKPIKDARGEVDRAILVFTIAAEESVRIYGEFQPYDISAGNKGYQGIVRHFPIGPVSMISPFNFPINLAAHKIAPALAVGCPWVLKPASRTPISALIMGEILSKTALPPGSFSILPCSRNGADLFTTGFRFAETFLAFSLEICVYVCMLHSLIHQISCTTSCNAADDRFKLVSFTGSPSVGWDLKAKSGKKKVVLELGGNAACIYDETTTDIDAAVERACFGAFYQSGQSCISIQRMYVHEKIYSEFVQKFVTAVSKLKKGDPLHEDTFVGPLISESEAKRIDDWVKEAVTKGAKVLTGGARDGVMYDATVVENVPKGAKLLEEEAFGPVVCIEKFSDFKTVIDKVNDSVFGLQAGVYTRDIHRAFYAFENLEVGGVMINDIPSKRVDSQPYGGVKESGLGREGLRYAMQDMMEPRVLMLKDIGKL